MGDWVQPIVAYAHSGKEDSMPCGTQGVHLGTEGQPETSGGVLPWFSREAVVGLFEQSPGWQGLAVTAQGQAGLTWPPEGVAVGQGLLCG